MESLLDQDIIQAGTYDDAYSYYQSYGNEMRFLPGSNNEGEIYYATKGKKDTSAGTRYTTIGWKVRVFNATGAVVDTIYYKLGGSHMTEINARTINGYEYCLYRVTLTNLKSRLSKAGLDALKSSDCNIVFDACISVRQNGQLQGGMTDLGISWGEVHTTYNGIVGAAPWSSATKESLHSYYNKTVDGLFYEVKLQKGKGIRKVSGAGRYCFGTTVSVQAECEDGYHFLNWTGSKENGSWKYSFVLYGTDVSLTANAKEKLLYKKFGSFGAYIYLLIKEIISANMTVLHMVLTEKEQMEPVIVTFRTNLKTEMARVILANSITLTPGTITVAIEEDELVVHCLDKSLAEGIEDSVFEQRLKELEKEVG